MDDHTDKILGTITGLVMALTAFGYMWMKMRTMHREMKRRDDFTDNRMDVYGQSVLRRGQAGAILKGFLHEGDSMANLSELAARAYAPIAPALRKLRRQFPDLPRERFAEKIEEKWGNWLSVHICTPLKVSDGECWAMALVVAETPTPKDEMPDSDTPGKAA